ncbi:hypothetical protein TNCT_315511 [Trichonephila clavata]|uniref:Uncharacterized protein n=1 Tax=Trichonephila clavata TaxID=2740835 RepID=A0A8X6KW38_TRICU|nr:hypothetical protein TNCT_315511 [Trichonephila clavata]
MHLPKILLSLQQICLSKIALSVFNERDVKQFTSIHSIHTCIGSSEEIEAFLGNEPGSLLNYTRVYGITFNASPHFTSQYKHYFTGDLKDHFVPNKQGELLVSKKISTLPLPSIMKKEVMALVQLLFIEYNKWFQDHTRIMNTPMNNMKYTTNLQNNFHWTQDNKIDRQKSAKAIIADNSIDIRHRFILASFYCFKDDMSSLRGMLNIWQLYSYAAERSFEMLVICIPWLIDVVNKTINNILRLFAERFLRLFLMSLIQW